MNKNKEEILNKLNKIEEIEKVNIINDIKYVGKREVVQELDNEIINKEIDVSVVIEDNTKKYFFNDECVAIETKNVGIIFTNEYKKYEKENPILDIIEVVKKDELNLEDERKYEKNSIEKIYSLNDLTEEKINEYSELLKEKGINKNEIKEICEISLEQEVRKEEKEEYGEENLLDKEETKKLNTMEETSTNQIIKGEPLWKAMGISSEYTKICIVYSNDVKNNDGTLYTFIVKKANGDSLILNDDIISLDKSEGLSKTERDLTIDVNGDVKEESSIGSFELKNATGDYYLKIAWDENSGREIMLEDRARGMGNKGVAYELETNVTRTRDKNSIEMQNERSGIYNSNEKYDNLKKHEKAGCKNVTVNDIDNNHNNDTHEHVNENELIPDTSITWRQFAGMIGERGEGSIEKAYKKFIEEKEKNPDINNEDLIKQIEEDVIEQSQVPKTRKR